jgi:hypothetical protein
VNVSGVTSMCNSPGSHIMYLGQVMTVKGISVYCPKDFAAFCSYRACPNWCNGHGLCVNGSCVCADPWSGPSCLGGCLGLYDSCNTIHNTAIDQCVNKCNPKQFILNQTCLSSCPHGY